MNTSESKMQTNIVIINKQPYREVAAKLCDECDIEHLSRACMKLNCCASQRADGRTVVYKKIDAPIEQVGEPELF